ncbi:YIP1 family protein [Sinirhodobacter sp. WL0062]|uniref:YIP1 family protein n=1 Tax=Rhodobacter flavimaris TaxID=2907145 RepID=A0ABS8YSP6_9RHOB|nr:YIP1 family protein [Sinirhodobacter sp. WL0062]MCE5972310.1 YIP1 family protein [Sinirhodobacter sp. WL0062]
MIAGLDLRQMVVRTFREPRVVARELIALNLPPRARLLALAIVIVVSAALGSFAEILFAFVTDQDMGEPASPVPMAIAQGALILYGATAMTVLGRNFGGRGRFYDALLLLTWMEFVLIVAQVVQVLVMVFFPITSVIAMMAMMVLLFWLLVQFTAALHGFENLFKVAFGVIVTFLGSAMIAGMLMVSLGFVPVPVTG